jgi:hypothetical protein
VRDVPGKEDNTKALTGGLPNEKQRGAQHRESVVHLGPMSSGGEDVESYQEKGHSCTDTGLQTQEELSLVVPHVGIPVCPIKAQDGREPISDPQNLLGMEPWAFLPTLQLPAIPALQSS